MQISKNPLPITPLKPNITTQNDNKNKNQNLSPNNNNNSKLKIRPFSNGHSNLTRSSDSDTTTETNTPISSNIYNPVFDNFSQEQAELMLPNLDPEDVEKILF